MNEQLRCRKEAWASRSVTAMGLRHLQPIQEGGRVAQQRRGLAIAQMGVDIHQADFAAEKGGRFRAAENALLATPVSGRLIHEPYAVGEEQMAADEAPMLLRLRLCEKSA